MITNEPDVYFHRLVGSDPDRRAQWRPLMKASDRHETKRIASSFRKGRGRTNLSDAFVMDLQTGQCHCNRTWSLFVCIQLFSLGSVDSSHKWWLDTIFSSTSLWICNRAYRYFDVQHYYYIYSLYSLICVFKILNQGALYQISFSKFNRKVNSSAIFCYNINFYQITFSKFNITWFIWLHSTDDGPIGRNVYRVCETCVFNYIFVFNNFCTIKNDIIKKYLEFLFKTIEEMFYEVL